MSQLGFPITITEKAYSVLITLLSKQKKKLYVRIGKKGKGCLSPDYSLALDDEKMENDRLFKLKNLSILIYKGDYMHLIGLQLDYMENDVSKGFKFSSKPMAKK